MTKINITELNKALSFLKPAVSARNIPGLDHLFFKNNTISAFNGHTSIIVKFPLDMEFAVPHTSFIKTMSSLSIDPTLEIDGDNLKIKAGRFKASFTIEDTNIDLFQLPDELPVVTELPTDSSFITGLARVYLGSHDSKIQESGINIFARDQQLDIIAYDGSSCSRYSIPASGASSVVIPFTFCEIIMKTFDTMMIPPTKLLLSNNFAVAEFTEDVKIYCSYFSTPPNLTLCEKVSDVFKTDDLGYVPIPDGFTDALKRFAGILEQSTLVQLNLANKHLVMTASNRNGLLEEEFDLEQSTQGQWTLPLVKLLPIQPYVERMKLSSRCAIFQGSDPKFEHAIAISNTRN